MTIQDVKQHIKDKSFQSYYIFTGDEIEIQRIYVNKIAETLGYRVNRIDAISDVWQDLTGNDMFGVPAVYVVRDDKDLMKDEILQERIDTAIGKNIVIHLITSVDKRTKWAKDNADRIVVFERLSSEVLKKYVQRLTALNNANCERLIAICENDYSRILLEIDKIRRMQIEDNEAFEQMLLDGAIYVPPKDAIFDFVDAVLKRNIPVVYDLLSQCYAVGEANMVLISVLYNNIKQVLQVQSHGGTDSEIVNATGMTQWQVKCARDKSGRYSIGELVDMLRLLQKIQKGIITGQIEDYMSIEYFLVMSL